MNDEEIRKSFENWYSGGNPNCPSIAKFGNNYQLQQTRVSWVAWINCAASMVKETK